MGLSYDSVCSRGPAEPCQGGYFSSHSLFLLFSPHLSSPPPSTLLSCPSRVSRNASSIGQSRERRPCINFGSEFLVRPLRTVASCLFSSTTSSPPFLLIYLLSCFIFFISTECESVDAQPAEALREESTDTNRQPRLPPLCCDRVALEEINLRKEKKGGGKSRRAARFSTIPPLSRIDDSTHSERDVLYIS